MEFKIGRTPNPNVEHYPDQDMEIAYKFSSKAYKEFGNFLKSIVLFGGVAKKKTGRADIDILLLVDDLYVNITPEMIEAYRVIVENMVNDTSNRLHITTLKLTSFWEYAKAGDPIIVNILRDGISLLDTGFFEPMQALFRQGRIRPTPESVWNYYSKAPFSIANSQWHVHQAVFDLYWAVIDSAHAALMKLGEIPPSPEHAADMLEEKMVKKKLLEQKYAKIMRKFYSLSRDVLNRKAKLTGKDYDILAAEANDFVARMKRFIWEKK